jgi:methylenetetrahydrofolate reductase (NADPH)
MRLIKKVKAGAKFIQTQAVFNSTDFQEWLDAAYLKGITEKAAIIAGIYPLESYDEAINLLKKYTDFYIPDTHLNRMKEAGDLEAQKKMGIAIAVETIGKIKAMTGLGGIHIIAGGREKIISEIIADAGL